MEENANAVVICGVLSLSDEILALIFDEVHSGARETLPALSLANKRFYRHATPLLYRSVALTPSKLEKLEGAEGTAYGSRLREIVSLWGRDFLIEGVGFDWTSLARVLDSLKHLDIIRWRSWDQTFPPAIANCMRRYLPGPLVYLEDLPMGHDFGLFGDSDAERLKFRLLDGLLDRGSITSIKAQVHHIYPMWTKQFKEFVLSCPNIEILHIRIPLTDDKTEWSVAPTVPYENFHVAPTDKLAPLRELILDSRLSNHPQIIPSTFWDWSRIQHLELRGPNMFYVVNEIQGQIHHLETLIIEGFCSVRVNLSQVTQLMIDFLSHIQGIVTLKLVNPSVILPISSITQYGATIKTLCYHAPRLPWALPSIRSALLLTPSGLESLSHSCPHLVSMTLQMPSIDDDLPYDFLAEIARFPALDTLRLYTNIGTPPGFITRTDPELLATHLQTDRLTVQYMAQYLCKLKAGCAFQKIEVMFGNYGLNNTPPCRFDKNERPNVLFTCTIHKSGDIVVEDDSNLFTDPGWAYYLDVENKRKIRGRPYPRAPLIGKRWAMSESRGVFGKPLEADDREQWRKSGEEADSIMAQGIHPKVEEDNMASLFGSSPERQE